MLICAAIGLQPKIAQLPQSGPTSDLLRHESCARILRRCQRCWILPRIPRSGPLVLDEPLSAAPVGIMCLFAGSFCSRSFAGTGPYEGEAGLSPGGLVLHGSCKADTTCPGDQGIAGVVRMVSGNRMPAPGVKRGPLPSVKTQVYVFELTNISQVVRKGSSPYYSSVHTRLVAVADTDSTGHFCVCLPEGRYSLFTRSGESYFASRRDVDNNLAPVEVSKGKMTQVECHIEGSRPPTY